MNPAPLTTVIAVSVLAATASGQAIPGSPAGALQVHYAARLNAGDSVINITNAGTQNTPTGAVTNICANVYAFTVDEALFSCCSCTVTPDALVSISVQHDMFPNVLMLILPSALVVKVIASTGRCNASSVAAANLADGLAAWGSKLHSVTVGGVTTLGTTETPFVQKGLSAADLARLTGYCGFIQAIGSGFGICRSCRQGGLGAARE